MPGEADFEHAYAVIMAGGSGTRFWPLSRRKRPKQLLDLLGPTTLLEQTVARIQSVIPPERTYIFTNGLLRGEVLRRLPAVPKQQVVAEPAARNTAPTVGLAAHEVVRRDPAGLMVVLPSDHIVRKRGVFHRVLRAACRWGATEGRSVVVGLKPTRPETGYGYIRKGPLAARVAGQEVCRVEKFTEKPPAAMARRYIASGRYLWNGGMFIWRASTLIQNLERCQPEMAGGLARIANEGGVRAPAILAREFPQLERVSIDYAVMEKVSNVFVVPADMGWSDVGSWAVAYELHRKEDHANVHLCNSVSIDSRGNMIVSPRKLVATVGVKDLIIVETDDALLVCARNRSQDVGKVVQELERRGLIGLL